MVNAIFLEALIVLGTALFSNSRQIEKAFTHKFDGSDSKVYSLADNGVAFTIFPYFYDYVYAEEDGSL